MDMQQAHKMLEPRLATHVFVGFVLKRVQAEGGFATILQKGDATSGTVLLICLERGDNPRVLEKRLGYDSPPKWERIWPKNGGKPLSLDEYLERRTKSDPDLWLVELDIPDAERLADEILLNA